MNSTISKSLHNIQYSGFTVMELIITIAIVGILATLVAPSFAPYLANQRTDTISTTLQSSLRYARNIAITRNMHTIICPSSNGTTCNGEDWSSGWVVRDLSGNVLQVQPAVFSNSIEACNVNSRGIEFNELGRSLAQPNCQMNSQEDLCPIPPCNFGAFLIRISGCSQMYQINMDPTGHINVSRPLLCE